LVFAPSGAVCVDTVLLDVFGWSGWWKGEVEEGDAGYVKGRRDGDGFVFLYDEVVESKLNIPSEILSLICGL
jgi:hypothetical protein